MFPDSGLKTIENHVKSPSFSQVIRKWLIQQKESSGVQKAASLDFCTPGRIVRRFPSVDYKFNSQAEAGLRYQG